MHLVDWIILAIIGAIAVYLHTGYAARRDIRRLLEETLAELRRVVDALDEPFVDLDDDAPDMIAALDAWTKERRLAEARGRFAEIMQEAA
ncbi:hypothetical protein [Methylocystis sp. S23]